MAYKTILVHCNDKRRIDALLAPTLTLAGAFQSHVVGLSVVPPATVIATGALGAPPVLVDAHCELYRQEVPIMRQRFDAAMAGKPVTAEWRDAEPGSFGVIGTVLEHGRTADLIVANQTDDDWPATEWLDIADRVAVESGRPTLIVPNGRTEARVGQRVLVAWNGSREAARAAFDALPVLQRAAAVNIVSIGEGDGDQSERSIVDICDALQRHGVKAKRAQPIAAQVGAGPALIEQADAFAADLVVMGCYGHSRLREFILGGASRHILDKMRVPVLMSH